MTKTVHVQPAIATPESDARIRKRETRKGWGAKTQGQPRESCPWDPASLTGKWWLEGYDSDLPPDEVEPQ
jgi:hypothetical protein